MTGENATLTRPPSCTNWYECFSPEKLLHKLSVCQNAQYFNVIVHMECNNGEKMKVILCTPLP